MRYAVKAMRGNSVVELRLEAEDEVAARETARKEGYTVLAVQRGSYAWPSAPRGSFRWRFSACSSWRCSRLG